MKLLRVVVLVSFLGLLQACGTNNKTVSYEWNTSSDPIEGVNRSIYSFNTKADKFVFRPLALGYDKTVPAPAKKGISNFFANLTEPLSAVNNLLQGKFNQSLQNTYRFAVNSTIGVFGFIDVAKHYGVDGSKEDFGQSLATWGVQPGPYIMLPFLGPSNLRDAIGRLTSISIADPINEITDSTSTEIGLNILNAVDKRAGLLSVDSAIESQLDPYLFIKTTVENSRTDAINDGKSSTDDEFDF